mgnify:CR=1 FL=1
MAHNTINSSYSRLTERLNYFPQGAPPSELLNKILKILLSEKDAKVANKIFNCGYENMSIMNIAKTVKKVVEDIFPEKGNINIEVTESDDPRSYHISSDKIKKELNFIPKYSVEDAVRDLCQAFKNGSLPNSFDDDKYFNVRTMKKLKVS